MLVIARFCVFKIENRDKPWDFKQKRKKVKKDENY